VESDPGRGSRFHFTARLGLSKEPRASQPAELSLKDVPVLIVDDNPVNLLILQETLANWGMRVRRREAPRPRWRLRKPRPMGARR